MQLHEASALLIIWLSFATKQMFSCSMQVDTVWSTCSVSSTGVVLLRLTLAWMLSPDRSSSATARARNSEMRPHSTVFCALLRRRSRLLQIRRAAVLASPVCACSQTQDL